MSNEIHAPRHLLILVVIIIGLVTIELLAHATLHISYSYPSALADGATINSNFSVNPHSCELLGDGDCGPYYFSGITNSNGFDTYVANQMWGCGSPGSCGPEIVFSKSPGKWMVTSTQPAGNTSVLTYPDVQQLFNNWTGDGWNANHAATDTPINQLKSLTSAYSESLDRNPGTIA